MPAPRFRSRTYRRVFTKVANRVSLQYRRRKPSQAKCGKCKTQLHGIPRALPYKMSNLPKTKKRPERPFGGNLCTKCTRSLIIEKHMS
tara:strand:- start:4322 stop:4585 length:264 start_codon:yes stop_codon:yes gene_type:complete